MYKINLSVLLLIFTFSLASANKGSITFDSPAKKTGTIKVTIYYTTVDGLPTSCVAETIVIPKDSSEQWKAMQLKAAIDGACPDDFDTQLNNQQNGISIITPDSGNRITEIDTKDGTNQNLTVSPTHLDNNKGNEVSFFIQGVGEQEEIAFIQIPSLGVFVSMPIIGLPADLLVEQLAQQLNEQFFNPNQVSEWFAIAYPLDFGAGMLRIYCGAEECAISSGFGGDSGYDWEIIMKSLQLSGDMMPPIPVLEQEIFPETFPLYLPASFIPLPGVIEIQSITPPLMLLPDNAFNYGIDYYAFQMDNNVLGIYLGRPGDYWVQLLLDDGTSQFDLFSTAPDMCGGVQCCGAVKRPKEIDCGAPDLAIISDGVTIKSWDSATKMDTVGSIAAAKQAICDEYDSNDPKVPISVGIKGHGSNGTIEIGDEDLNIDNIEDFTNGLKGKISTLRLFSCNTGETDEFICALEQKLGCDVIASDDVMRHTKILSTCEEEWFTFGKMVSWNPKGDIKFETPASVAGTISAKITGIKADGTAYVLDVLGGTIHPIGTDPETKADSLVKRINEQIFLDPFLHMEATVEGNHVIIKTLDGDKLIKLEIFDLTKQTITSIPTQLSGVFKTVEMPISGIAEEGFSTLTLHDLDISATVEMTGKTAEQIAQELKENLITFIPFSPAIMTIDLEVMDPLNVVMRIQSLENIGAVTADFGGNNGISANHAIGGYEIYPLELFDPGSDPFIPRPWEYTTTGILSLHDIALLSISPPLMLNPNHAYEYGTDFSAYQLDENSYAFNFTRPGSYLIQGIDDGGDFFEQLIAVDVRPFCIDINDCCVPVGRAIEIPCGNPADNDSIDLAIKSSTLNLGYDPDWDNARSEVEAASVAEAKQAICDAYAANGNEPISVAIDAHGNTGYFKIGNEVVDQKTLKNFVNGIKGKISQLRLFSCNTGTDSKFICQLERLLCCDVISSTGSVSDIAPDKQDETGQHWFVNGGNLVSWEPGNEIAILASINLDAPSYPSSDIYIPKYLENELLPPLEPFSGFGYPFDTPPLPMDPLLLDTNYLIPILPIDWIYFEFINPNNPEEVYAAKALLINQSGDIVDVFGAPLIELDLDNILPFTSEQMQLRIRTKSSVTEVSEPFQIDSFFDIYYEIEFNTRTGDVNFDNAINAADRSGTWNQRNQVGYLPADVNYDGSVNASDRSLTWNNRNETGN